MVLNLFTSLVYSSNKPVFEIGDKVKIWADKSYRKSSGSYFQAIGNVIVISGNNTLYGEKLTLDTEQGLLKVEGNVRYISQDFTIYGSHIDYNLESGRIEMNNIRVITPVYNVVASKIIKVDENQFIAEQAEFTTCRDCVESWAIWGDTIHLTVGEYVHIKNALFKVKGINISYLPYIIFPVKNQRESGLLVPQLLSVDNEGLGVLLPFFWAINETSDMTITPSFWGERGYGADLEYRKNFKDRQWLYLNSRIIDDQIYAPFKKNREDTGTTYLRHFSELEGHYQYSNDLSAHILFQDARDDDIFVDQFNFTDDKQLSSDYGLSGFVEKRFSHLTLGVDASYAKNMITDDPEEFDNSFVQTLPSAYFYSRPLQLFKIDSKILNTGSFSIDGDFTHFKQNRVEEVSFLRNVKRTNVLPKVNLNLLSHNGFFLDSFSSVSFQNYDFHNDQQENFYKYKGHIQTRFSFSLARIFGVAYEKTKQKTQVDYSQITTESDEYSQTLKKYEKIQDRDEKKITVNSYKHSQRFSLIHHLTSSSEVSDKQHPFFTQIKDPIGRFDEHDSFLVDFSDPRFIPRDNSLELTWENNLIKKTPTNTDAYSDFTYLHDNFSYSQLGYFNLSQGVDLSDKPDGAQRFSDRLSRLRVDMGYRINFFRISSQLFYFHQNKSSIMNLTFNSRLKFISLLARFSRSNVDESLKVLELGARTILLNQIGISYRFEKDLIAKQNISSVAQVDYMPSNECWNFNLQLRETANIDRRLSFNFMFNYGQNSFDQYKQNYLNF